MAKKIYVLYKVPTEVDTIYKKIKMNMETDLKKLTGKNIKMTMPKVMTAIASPKFNEKAIQIDYKKLVRLGKAKRGKYE